MSTPMRDRIAFWLERWPLLHRYLFAFDGYAPTGLPRFRNRINGHVVVFGKGVDR